MEGLLRQLAGPAADDMSRLVTLENDVSPEFKAVFVRPGGRLLLNDGELMQVFDLIVDYFQMDARATINTYYNEWDGDWGRDPRLPFPTNLEFDGVIQLQEQEGGHADAAIDLIQGNARTSLSDALKDLGLEESGRGRRARISIEILD